MSFLFGNLLEQQNYLGKLLEIPVDELAGALLIAIKNKDKQIAEYKARKDAGIKPQFQPTQEITYNALKETSEQEKTDNKDDLDDLLYALMDATQFLINHGFLAQIPLHTNRSNTMYSIPTYFLTRKANTIQTINDWKTKIKEVTR